MNEAVLKHVSFRALRKLPDHWEIAHVSHDGVSIAAICGKSLSEVVLDYRKVCRSIDVSRHGKNHDHNWYKSIDGGTELCDCGAWR
jgi:hypothetical protein